MMSACRGAALWSATSEQYDTVSDTLGLNTQLRWIIEPGNELFVVYNHNWLIRDDEIRATVREGRIKVRYTYRF